MKKFNAKSIGENSGGRGKDIWEEMQDTGCNIGDPGNKTSLEPSRGQNRTQTLISEMIPSKESAIWLFKDQFIPQGTFENNRATSQQLLEFNSWVWLRKDRKRAPPPQPWWSNDLRVTVDIPNLCFPEEQPQKLNTIYGRKKLHWNSPTSHETNIQADNSSMFWKGRGVPVPRGAMIYCLKCVVSNNKKLRALQRNRKVWPMHWRKKQAKKLSETPDVGFIRKRL